MSNIVIPLTVLSINNTPLAVSETMLFVSDRMRDVRDNQNVGATTYALDLPGDSQFAYKREIASNLYDKYTVDEDLAAILALINPTP